VLCDPDRELVPRLVEALRLLEDDSLGGGGSRGSGRVRFSGLRITWRSRDFYAGGAPEQEVVSGGDIAAVQSQVAGSDFAGKLA